MRITAFTGRPLSTRCDFCSKCWTETNQEANKASLSFWKSIHRIPPLNPLEDIVALAKFFDALRENKDAVEGTEEILYVIAMFLLRKRRLKLITSKQQDNSTIMEFEKLWNGEKVELKEIQIGDERIDDIRTKILSLFQTG